jgi:hypothetical protein
VPAAHTVLPVSMKFIYTYVYIYAMRICINYYTSHVGCTLKMLRCVRAIAILAYRRFESTAASSLPCITTALARRRTGIATHVCTCTARAHQHTQRAPLYCSLYCHLSDSRRVCISNHHDIGRRHDYCHQTSAEICLHNKLFVQLDAHCTFAFGSCF